MTRHLKIGPYTFDVNYQDGYIIEEGNLGCCVVADSRIEISKAQSRQRMQSVLLHEALEAINTLYNLRLRHHQIDLLETTLYDLLASNPDFTQDIKEANEN